MLCYHFFTSLHLGRCFSPFSQDSLIVSSSIFFVARFTLPLVLKFNCVIIICISLFFCLKVLMCIPISIFKPYLPSGNLCFLTLASPFPSHPRDRRFGHYLILSQIQMGILNGRNNQFFVRLIFVK